MEYHLDNRVVLSSEREHKSLYSWSIKEFDQSGKQIGRDQIPWDWSVNFDVIEFKPSLSLRIEVGNPQEPESRKVESTEYLYGKLRPSAGIREAGLYELFGTQREIEQFGLFIYRVAEGVQQRCSLWGSLSYTADWDFQDVTEPDCIQIYVHLSPDKFDHIVRFVKSPLATRVTIRLKGVSGFYSEWSPSIRTDSIKVLANLGDQKLENPENLVIDPPTLGHVQEFELFLKQECPLSPAMED